METMRAASLHGSCGFFAFAPSTFAVGAEFRVCDGHFSDPVDTAWAKSPLPPRRTQPEHCAHLTDLQFITLHFVVPWHDVLSLSAPCAFLHGLQQNKKALRRGVEDGSPLAAQGPLLLRSSCL